MNCSPRLRMDFIQPLHDAVVRRSKNLVEGMVYRGESWNHVLSWIPDSVTHLLPKTFYAEEIRKDALSHKHFFDFVCSLTEKDVLRLLLVLLSLSVYPSFSLHLPPSISLLPSLSLHLSLPPSPSFHLLPSISLPPSTSLHIPPSISPPTLFRPTHERELKLKLENYILQGLCFKFNQNLSNN